MQRNLRYSISFLPAILVITGNLMGNYYTLLNPVFVLGFLAFIEWFLPNIGRNDDTGTTLLPDFWLAGAVIIQLLSLGSLLYGIGEGILYGQWLIWAVIGTGLNSGALAIVSAHEMIHRPTKRWVWLGNVQLFTVLNAYFYIDHLRVHHRHIGTTSDHATARYGEHFYRFIVRSILGQFKAALRISANEAVKAGKAAYGLHNHTARATAGHIVLLGVLAAIHPLWMLAWLAQAVIANVLLEYTNYIEHYGLSRADNERVHAGLSWQSDRFFSRFLLYDLSRHADHHLYGGRPYHLLKHHDASPELPGGYASMIFPALIPPLWFAIVHPKLKNWEKAKNQAAAELPQD